MEIDWMNEEEAEELLSADYEKGDLCLGIYCHRCNAQFELGKEGVALATMMKTPFWEYVKFVQAGKCKVCNPEMKEL